MISLLVCISFCQYLSLSVALDGTEYTVVMVKQTGQQIENMEKKLLVIQETEKTRTLGPPYIKYRKLISTYLSDQECYLLRLLTKLYTETGGFLGHLCMNRPSHAEFIVDAMTA